MPQAKSQPEDVNGQNVKVSYGTASLPLRAFYSSSRSSVRIQPGQAVPACGELLQVTVHYHILATELGHGAARARFYHLVSAGQAGQLCAASVSARGPLPAQKGGAEALSTLCSVHYPLGYGQRVPCASWPNNSAS